MLKITRKLCTRQFIKSGLQICTTAALKSIRLSYAASDRDRWLLMTARPTKQETWLRQWFASN